MSRTHNNFRRLAGALALLALLPGGAVRADDTEIFQSVFDINSPDSPRAKVLIIFDDSGSMSTNVTERPDYDGSTTYSTQGSVQSGRIYWSTGGQPPSTGTDNWFDASLNRCAESFGPLTNQGFFQGYVSMYRDFGTGYDWREMNDNFRTTSDRLLHVECEADVVNSNALNGATVSPAYASQDNNPPYGASDPSTSDVNFRAPDGDNNPAVTLYSANYMNWYHNSSLSSTRSRIAIARDVVSDLIDANPTIDFGLMTFNSNRNTSEDGGRVIRGIVENMTSTDRANMVATVQSLVDDGNTPLCESTYEAYRYLAGKTVKYGYELGSGDTPPRDKGAEDPEGTYAPPETLCQFSYVILMTDGQPVADTSANSEIEALTGKTCGDFNGSKNCLPEIAEWMYNNDLDGDDTNGIQKAKVFTIGFATDQQLLEDTAQKGGGQYYTSDSAAGLADAFRGAITEILSTTSTFSSPSVAVDTFTRTQSRNDIFFAMFEPQAGQRWPGNIKKLRLDISGGSGQLIDANGDPGIDSSTGFIDEQAQTFWSPEQDGGVVTKGGVGGLLAARDPGTRTIYINTGSGGALENFESANVTAAALGVANDQELFDAFGVADQTELDEVLLWARGYDVDDRDEDNSTSDPRPWILGDMLHSRPLVINYGARSGFTQDDPELRIVVGTNEGFLHMFSNDDGQEDWAIFLKELAPLLKARFDNETATQRLYGIDGTPTLLTEDLNGDGTIDHTVGDKAYVYFGLRRGGKGRWALDLSNPDAPSVVWQVDDTQSGFAELGQSWPDPVNAIVPGYSDPVLVMTAGYDLNKDLDSHATPDSTGRGLFIVDAATGALVWSVTPAANSAKNLQETGLEHSVAAQPAVLDSNGDGITDRIYFADTGGNVWRVDMPGASLPDSNQDTWRITQLADFNSGALDLADDRRFFNQIDVVQTRKDGKLFDAVLLGSGDRTSPRETDTDDRFYMIRDEKIGIYTTAPPTASECVTDPSIDFRCKLPLTDSDLYDATDNTVQDGSIAAGSGSCLLDLDGDGTNDPVSEQDCANAALRASNGWYIRLESLGEKSLAPSTTIGGKVFFTTYSPDVANVNLCQPQPGTGRLYVVSLDDASAEYQFGVDDDLSKEDRTALLGSLIPDTPSVHYGSDREIRLLFPAGGGIQAPGAGECEGVVCETDETFPQPFGTFWYREEY
jgi:type IV pilus assembly protein PilY1